MQSAAHFDVLHLTKLAAYPDLFWAFLPVLTGRSLCCPPLPFSAWYQAGFWTGFAPGRFAFGFLDLGMEYPFQMSCLHRRSDAGWKQPTSARALLSSQLRSYSLALIKPGQSDCRKQYVPGGFCQGNKDCERPKRFAQNSGDNRQRVPDNRKPAS